MAKAELMRQKSRNTALMTTKVVEQPVAGMMSNDIGQGSYMTSFIEADPEYMQLMFLSDDNATYTFEDFLTKPFHLVNWAVKKIAMPHPETGEMLPACRTVLINEMNETLGFVSQGVLLSLDMIRIMFGDGPYKPALPIICKQIRTGRGFHVIKIQPDFASLPKKL
jgi:hypothetical protein